MGARRQSVHDPCAIGAALARDLPAGRRLDAESRRCRPCRQEHRRARRQWQQPVAGLVHSARRFASHIDRWRIPKWRSTSRSTTPTGMPSSACAGTDNVVTHWLDPALAAQQKSLQNAFKGLDVDVLDRSVVGRRVLVQVESMSSPPVYQLVDFEQGRADIVAEAYPGLDPAALGTVRYFKYHARDGTPIPAYLTLPPGRPATDLPVVILPHGGPRITRRGRIRLVAAVPRHAWVRGAAAAVSRIDGLRRGLPEGRLPAMGRADAERRLRRCAAPGRHRRRESRTASVSSVRATADTLRSRAPRLRPISTPAPPASMASPTCRP